jgi:hypothetical protein
VLSENPSVDEIARAVNTNALRVRSLTANYATLNAAGAPQLRAAVFVERPGRFRIRGTHAFTGPEIDLGCNDEQFWLWIKRSEPKAMYFARHDRLASSGLRRLIPLSPQQLVEAFGLSTLDPQAAHQGPFQQGPDRLAIRSTIAAPEGQLARTTIVDARTAWVVEQQLHDPSGQLLATVKTSDHRTDATSGAVLPHMIELTIPSGNLSMTLSIERWEVNTPAPADAWQKPEQPGYPNVDASDPSQMPAAAGLAASPASYELNVNDGRSRYGQRSEARDSGWRTDNAEGR